jgi:hypothetical protein
MNENYLFVQVTMEGEDSFVKAQQKGIQGDLAALVRSSNHEGSP